MASSMKASAPAANKCRNFSSGNKVTLPVAQVQVVDAQVKVAPDRAGLVPVVDAQVKVAPDKADLVKVAKVALDHLIP